MLKQKKEATLADIERLEAEVKECELNLSYTKIYAPQDGLITNRNVEKGNYVQIAQTDVCNCAGKSMGRCKL